MNCELNYIQSNICAKKLTCWNVGHSINSQWIRDFFSYESCTPGYVFAHCAPPFLTFVKIRFILIKGSLKNKFTFSGVEAPA